MPKLPRLFFCVAIMFTVGVYHGSSGAQQFDITSIMPSFTVPQLQQRGIPPVPEKPIVPERPQVPSLPTFEPLSEYEQFIAGTIDVTEKEFEILQKYGITFSQQLPPFGKIKVPARIIKLPEHSEVINVIDKIEKVEKINQFMGVPQVIDAGYLIGTYEQMSTAFQMLGIKGPFVTTSGIRQFGYDLFQQPPSTFAPVENVPVGPDYVVGPGDELRITVWGKFEGLWSAVVDRDGNIDLPKVGIIGVTGMTFKEVKEAIFKEFSKYYTGFEMNVSMGSLRTMQVYVVGNARHPGAYTVSSLSTLVNVLFEAGGPDKTGSFRDIQVKRNGETVVHFDLYDLLLRGDKTRDVRLMPEDVVYISPVGPLAAIIGSVNNPAIYELSGSTTVSQLIEMAGGLNSAAFKGRVQVEQIVDKGRQVVFDSELDDMQGKDIALKAGDVVRIFQVIRDRKVIRLSGAVLREGEYGVTPGMTVKDLISMAGGLRYYAFDREAELVRMHVTDEGPVTEKLSINLKEALNGDPADNILLQDNDYLFVRTVPEWELSQVVSVLGEVKFPGTYAIKKGEKLSSLIERAGGYTDSAYLRGAVFTRERVKELQQKQIDTMVERLERELLVRGAAETAAAISPEEAKIKEFEIKQKKDFVEKLKTIKAHGRMAIVLNEPEALKKTTYDIELEANDSIFVPQNPRSIQIIGAVYNQGAFVYDKSRNVPGYVEMAGGYTDNANKSKSYVLKVDGTAVKSSKGLFDVAWSKDTNRWEFGSRDLEPGDTIVVPEKLEKIPWMRNIKDLTQILYQIATAAGVIIVAF